jgi:hypothetical protein
MDSIESQCPNQPYDRALFMPVDHDHVSSSANCRNVNVPSVSARGSAVSPCSLLSSSQAHRVSGSRAQSRRLNEDRSLPFGPYLGVSF